MPYKVKKQGDEYVVYKKDTGKRVGATAGNKEALRKYLAALHLNANESLESIDEESKGLWANIRAKQARGEKSASKGSEAYNKAVTAAKKIKTVKNKTTLSEIKQKLAMQKHAGVISEDQYEKRLKLAEDEADDLKKWMDTPLKALGAEPTNKLTDPAKPLVSKGSEDGDTADDEVIKPAGGSENIDLQSLKASQNEVGMEQSLENVMIGMDATWDGINWGDVNWLVTSMAPGAVITFKSPILGAKTKDGMVVLDGHHRWSQAFMVNPLAKVNVVLADASTLTADQTLKAVHLAILAKTGASKTKGPKGGNLFQAGDTNVKEYLDRCKIKVDPKTGKLSEKGVAPYIAAVMQIQNITDPIAGEAAAIKRVMQSIQVCAGKQIGSAPSRDAMPQADGDSSKPTNAIDAKQALDLLATGTINYNPPFKSGAAAPVAESVHKTVTKMLNEAIKNKK